MSQVQLTNSDLHIAADDSIVSTPFPLEFASVVYVVHYNVHISGCAGRLSANGYGAFVSVVSGCFSDTH